MAHRLTGDLIMGDGIDSEEGIGAHIKRASETVETFEEEALAWVGRVTTGVENLIALARLPKAAPPNVGEDVRAALAQFDSVVGRLGDIKGALNTVASKVEDAGAGANTASPTPASGSSATAGDASSPDSATPGSGGATGTGDAAGPGEGEGIPIGGGSNDPTGEGGEPPTPAKAPDVDDPDDPDEDARF
jgi:hypothetical protein